MSDILCQFEYDKWVRKLADEVSVSECASEDIDDADECGRIPFDGDSSIDFVVPEAGAGDVESAVSFLHDDTVGDEFEVFIDSCDGFEDLYLVVCTSSHIWLVQICASFTL